MAGLKWVWTNETNLVGRAKSNNGEHWRVDILRDGECTLSGTSYNLRQLVDITHDCTCKAKAACQAAEDKICDDGWPKYAHFDKWASPTQYHTVCKDGYRAPSTWRWESCKHKEISKAEAMSRLDENQWPKYYGSNDYYTSSCRDRFAFYKAHSPERIDAIQANGISRGFSCPGIVFANKQISETDAISRLDESATTTVLRCWLSKIGR